MSHIPERKEKDCLNCGAIVQGRYCQVCGQENVVPKETFWHMVTHFFYDITHFDSKFFETIKVLIFKPGFLSKQYMLGRRARYLHPIKMYVFTSAMFFLLFFSFFKPRTNFTDVNQELSPRERADFIRGLQRDLEKDTGNITLRQLLAIASDSTRPLTFRDVFSKGGGTTFITIVPSKHRSFASYDSAQEKLPRNERDGWLLRKLTRKQIDLNEQYRENPKAAGEKFASSILHKLPYMLFVSLPLFALILQLVYLRRRKQFYYADHGVFTIHLYIFTFLMLLLVFLIAELQEATDLGFLGYVMALLSITLFFYLYKAMRNFYGQRRAKTFLKFILVTFWSLVMMLILLILFFLISAITL